MSRSTTSGRVTKPAKPYPDFPLFAHATKRWAKKIRGRTCYFGPWDDPQGALNRYREQADDLHAGRTPRVHRDGLTVRDLCNQFLTTKELLKDGGELSVRTFNDQISTAKRVVEAFGKTRAVDELGPMDFAKFRESLAKTLGPVALGVQITRTRVIFNYGYKEGLIQNPIRFGMGFNRPSKKVIRQARNSKGPCMFEADELRQILEAADVHLNAMVLLGISAGLGNTDIGGLPFSAIDLKSGWLNYPRAKTAINRRCKLWPETLEALRASIAKRTTPKNEAHNDLIFITKYGGSWNKDDSSGPISGEMVKLLQRLGLHRHGVAFYALRHTFETIGGGSRDQIAVNAIMGHADESMAAVYRERIDDQRLIAVTDHVRAWLWPDAQDDNANIS